MKKIYLDYAAATPLDKKVRLAMEPYFEKHFHNPSALYLDSRAVRDSMAKARKSVASWLGSKPAEIFFTAGTTEANNLAVQGVMNRHGGEVLVSAIEHDSVLAPSSLYKHQQIPVDKKGVIILNKLSKLIKPITTLISVMYVNNELGTIQPLPDIARLVANERFRRQKTKNHKPIYFHTDAAQAPNYLPLKVSRLGVDMMSLNGSKIYGPKQTGILYVKAGLQLQPLILGGGQEQGLRSGTENVPGIIGFARALDLTQTERAGESARQLKLRDYFEQQILAKIPGAIINGYKANRTPHLTSLTISGVDNERLIMELDEAGIQAAVGSACSASSDLPSHVLKAIGLKDDMARSTLRFSLGRQTNRQNIDKVIKTLSRLASQSVV